MSRVDCEAQQVQLRHSTKPARLNLGDCFSYAIAKGLGLKLLYKGDDFSKTDMA